MNRSPNQRSAALHGLTEMNNLSDNSPDTAESAPSPGGEGLDAAKNYNLEVALWYASHGIPIFPVHVTPTGSGWNKRPAINGWQSSAATDARTIAQWWVQFPNAAVGIPLGQIGVIVIDADRHGQDSPDGVANLQELLRENEWPEHPVADTAGGGEHHFFRNLEGENALGNGEGTIANLGINVRGSGGFIVAPLSRRLDKQMWEPRDSTPHLAEAFSENSIPIIPDWLAERLRKPRTPAGQKVGERERSYAVAALRGCESELKSASNGARNNTLNTFA
jgi:Bifunctional DNA primase/polymerase, N-terminal